MKEGIRDSKVFFCLLSLCYVNKLQIGINNCKLEFDRAIVEVGKEYIFIEGTGFDGKLFSSVMEEQNYTQVQKFDILRFPLNNPRSNAINLQKLVNIINKKLKK